MFPQSSYGATTSEGAASIALCPLLCQEDGGGLDLLKAEGRSSVRRLCVFPPLCDSRFQRCLKESDRYRFRL